MAVWRQCFQTAGKHFHFHISHWSASSKCRVCNKCVAGSRQFPTFPAKSAFSTSVIFFSTSTIPTLCLLARVPRARTSLLRYWYSVDCAAHKQGSEPKSLSNFHVFSRSFISWERAWEAAQAKLMTCLKTRPPLQTRYHLSLYWVGNKKEFSRVGALCLSEHSATDSLGKCLICIIFLLSKQRVE